MQINISSHGCYVSYSLGIPKYLSHENLYVCAGVGVRQYVTSGVTWERFFICILILNYLKQSIYNFVDLLGNILAL